MERGKGLGQFAARSTTQRRSFKTIINKLRSRARGNSAQGPREGGINQTYPIRYSISAVRQQTFGTSTSVRGNADACSLPVEACIKKRNFRERPHVSLAQTAHGYEKKRRSSIRRTKGV